MGENKGGEEGRFRMDGELIRILPLGGATIRHPNAPERPALEKIEGKWYLVFRMQKADSETEISRTFGLDNFSEADLDRLRECYSSIDFQNVIDNGLRKGLEAVEDPQARFMFLALLSAFHPRHVAQMMFLYREAHYQGNGPTVYFRTNDLLDSLYDRSNNGAHPSNLRGQLWRDLWELNTVAFHFQDPQQDPDSPMLRYLVRSPLNIESYEVDKRRIRFSTGDFDLAQACESDRLPDAVTVKLLFFRTIEQQRDYILLPLDINLKQPHQLQPARNYSAKLQTLLLSYYSQLNDSEYFHLGLQEMFDHLELTGRNTSRKKSVVWEAIEKLKTEGWILDSREVDSKEPAKKKRTISVRFLMNPAKVLKV